jgi:hypothetical protein
MVPVWYLHKPGLEPSVVLVYYVMINILVQAVENCGTLVLVSNSQHVMSVNTALDIPKQTIIHIMLLYGIIEIIITNNSHIVLY